METVRRKNPEFRHSIFNERQCREFIQMYFDSTVLHAYDTLIPKAYKADLWRYCVLYIHGGIYLDAKMKMGKRRLIHFTDREYFVRDVICSGWGIFNGCIICRPQNPIMQKAILQIVENVRQRFYGKTCLYPTGPMMLRAFFSKKELLELPWVLYIYDLNRRGSNEWGIMDSTKQPNKYPLHDQMILLKNDVVYAEQQKAQEHYSKLWKKKKIYRATC